MTRSDSTDSVGGTRSEGSEELTGEPPVLHALVQLSGGQARGLLAPILRVHVAHIFCYVPKRQLYTLEMKVLRQLSRSERTVIHRTGLFNQQTIVE